MEKQVYSDQELRFTAVLYATRKDVVEHLQIHGKLPEHFPPAGLPTAAKVIERIRGRDPILNEVEQLIYEAILREKRLPGGGVLLYTGCVPIYSLEQNQQIE